MTTPTGSPSIFGGIGKLEFAPTNGPDDPFPTWEDITTRVETDPANDGGPLTIIRGAQPELSTIEPSQLTCVLRNADSRFTFGYTGGTYGSGWAPAKQIRYTETIGGQVIPIFQGNLEYPDIADWQPIGAQYVQLSATDRLARLSRGRPFISTLGEHIRFRGGSALKWYYPCLDGTTMFRDVISTTETTWITSLLYQTNPAVTPDSGTKSFTAQGGDPVIADDADTARVTSRTGTSGGSTTNADWFYLGPRTATNNSPTAVTVAAGQLVTYVGWFRPEMPQSKLCTLLTLTDNTGTAEIDCDASGNLTITKSGSPSGSVTGTVMPDQAWMPIAIRYGWDTGVLELWVGTNQYTGSMSGSPPGSNAVYPTYSSTLFAGSFAHVQMYVGAAGDWAFTDYLAQVAMAGSCLEQQTTGQRINTILDYAGVQGRVIDPGVTFMQRATLAGQNPLTALQNAANTDRGRLFCDGTNRVVFQDRNHTYNV